MKPANSIEFVTCLIKMRFNADTADSAIQLLLSVSERIEAKAGCQSCSISREALESNRIRYNEVWASESEFTAHVQSDEFRNVLAAMDMCCEEPSVVIGTLAGREGIAYLRDLRDRTK